MGQGRFRLLFFVSVVASALIAAGSAGASSCGTRLLTDWHDGRIDGTYSVQCYRDALADLPEDIKVYSTAQDDLTRALQVQLRSERATARPEHENGGVSSWLVVAISASVLVAAASVAAALR